MESLESEPESNSLATVPAIMVTPVSGPSQSVDVTEESAEQNVPVSRDHPESLEAEVAELLEEVEPLKEGEEVTAEQGTEGKERLVQKTRQVLRFQIFHCSVEDEGLKQRSFIRSFVRSFHWC